MKTRLSLITAATMFWAGGSYAQTKFYKELEKEHVPYIYDAKAGETEEIEIVTLQEAQRSKGLTGTEYFYGVPKAKSPVRFNKSKNLTFLIEMRKEEDPQVALALFNIFENPKTNNREIIKGSYNPSMVGTLVNSSKKSVQTKFPFTAEKIGAVKTREDNVLRWLVVESLPAGEYYWDLGGDTKFFFGVDDTGTELAETPLPVLKEVIDAPKIDPKEVATPYEEKYGNGTVKIKGTKKGGKDIGDWTEYHSDGQIDEEKKYDEQGTLLMKRKYWNGKIEEEEFYVNGVREGVQKKYGRSGVLEKESMYKNGKREGLTIEYHRDTKIKEKETNYVNDKEDGQTVKYSETGKVVEKGQYYEGEMEGKWQSFSDAGKLISVYNYKKGQMDGPQEIYNNGKVVKKMIYKEGVKIQ
jgi:antitoxin component YwqK of YwqJK toxin-antitoxin module